MKGLLYHDISLIRKRFSLRSQLLMVSLILVISIVFRELAGMVCLISLPLIMAGIPVWLMPDFDKCGWIASLGLLPIRKRSIVNSKYVVAVGIVVFYTLVTLAASLISFSIWQEYNLTLYLLIAMASSTSAIWYVLVSIPTVVRWGTVGSTLSSVGFGCVALVGVILFTKTSLGTSLLDFLTKLPVYQIILANYIGLIVGFILSIKTSRFFYQRQFS